jgi:hypothetical protein
MTPLPRDASDADLIGHVDRWAALLEAEDYDGAFAFVEHDPDMGWTPDLIRELIKGYGEGSPGQKVTVEGKPSDVQQRKTVTRWSPPAPAGVGEIWYDLNIDWVASDLTATFNIIDTPRGLALQLNDLHVM